MGSLKMTQNGVGQQNQRSFGRFLFCMVIWVIILTQCGTYWIYETIDKFVNIEEPIEVEVEEETKNHQIKPHINSYKTSSDKLEEERERMFLQISEYCLPKLVCELHATLPGARSFTDSEKSLMALIGSSWLGATKPSKYHYAAHFGQLIQGFEGNGCHNLYPMCPFSGEDVQQ